ncbi:MAG TPA: ribbon-helix-helix protein, CopG family [Candidatus Limnocylindrales bacterium]|nr:ribbon-helix-helix protein, CopG family [Candidatus Limnocylindrales bacterium]
MAHKRVVISMPEALVEALNRATATSPQSRSEIVCAAVQGYLEESSRLFSEERQRVAEDAFFNRVSEMIESGLLNPEDFAPGVQEQPRPKGKLWIN